MKTATKRPAAKKAAAKKAAARKPAAGMTLAEAMKALEKAGSAQTRKTYTRHGAQEPMFGVSFATLKTLVKRIGVDHDLAKALWATRNFDARNLAMKIADPARATPDELGAWAKDTTVRMCAPYVAMLASEGPHASAMAARWLSSKDETERCAGWTLLGQLAMRDEGTPDAWFAGHLATIEKSLQGAPNAERYAMNNAVIQIGCRSAALRKAAVAAAKRIGPVEVDHGDTACKTPIAAEYIDKTWAFAASKGFDTPSAQERAREAPRTRC